MQSFIWVFEIYAFENILFQSSSSRDIYRYYLQFLMFFTVDLYRPSLEKSVDSLGSIKILFNQEDTMLDAGSNNLGNITTQITGPGMCFVRVRFCFCTLLLSVCFML